MFTLSSLNLWSLVYIFFLFKFALQILVTIRDASGRIHYESTACVAVMLSRVVWGLKTSMSSEGSKAMDETLHQIVDHARTSGVVELLLGCLAASGSSLMSGTSNMVPAACETCKAIWYLINALEIISVQGQVFIFPLVYSRQHPLSQPDVKTHEHGLWIDTESAKIIEMIVKLFLESKPVQLAIYYCFHNGLESALHAALQVSL